MRKALLKRYRVAIAMALFFMAVELSIELLQPYLIWKVIDLGITPRDLSVIYYWGIVLIVCSMISLISGVLTSFFCSHVSQSIGFDVREKLYAKLQAFSFADFHRFPTSSLITRLTNDVLQVQNTIYIGLRYMLRAPLLMIGSVIMVFVVNVKLALILFIGAPVLFGFIYWAIRKASTLFRAVQGKMDDVNGIMKENLAGIRLIKAFLRSEHETERFTHSVDDLMQRNASAYRVTESTMPVILLLMHVGVIGVLWFGNIEIQEGAITVGVVVAIVNYAIRITGVLSSLSMIIMSFTRAITSGNRIGEVLRWSENMSLTSDAATSNGVVKEGRIELIDVTFQYPDMKEPALQGISFSLKPRETAAILGVTGSGKSSLFQLFPRLYEVNEGSILIDGTDIRTMDPVQLRQHIGYVPQEPLLFSGTIEENIRWGKEDATAEEIIEAARHAQLHETILKLPKQYETVLGQRGVNLSGGQKQRLTIARALIRKPKLLLLDDSTSALDLKTEAELLRALKEYACTTLIITQKISTTLIADQIILLEDGKLIARGTHEALLKTSPLYQRIYQSQFGAEAI